MIPVTLIGGFLGAGKTTLLNHILSEDHGVRAAVLVNDFGAINIDAKLIVGVEDDTLNLVNGCVCCTIRGDFAQAVLNLLARPEPPEHVFVELSGVSDPLPVLNTFLETELSRAFSVNAILTLVDCEQFPRLTGEMLKLAQQQLGVADIVLLNKVDLVGPDETAGLTALIKAIAPGSRILKITHGSVPFDLIMTGGERHPAEAARPADIHRAHDHHHDRTFATWSWTCDRPLSLPKLRDVIETLPDAVYRCKGVVHIEELPVRKYVLQMVGKRYQFEDAGPWGGEQPHTEIVLIGGRDAIDTDRLQAAFQACIGTGDESQSPVLRLVRKLRPDLLDGDQAPPTRDHL